MQGWENSESRGQKTVDLLSLSSHLDQLQQLSHVCLGTMTRWQETLTRGLRRLGLACGQWEAVLAGPISGPTSPLHRETRPNSMAGRAQQISN